MRLRSKFWGTVLLSMAVFFMITGGPAWAQSAEVNALPFAGTHQPLIIEASGDVSVNGGTVTLDGAVVTVETADLNDDGVPDIVAGGGTLFAYDVANKAYLWALDESSGQLAQQISDIAVVADVTGDGTPDVVTIDYSDPDGSTGVGSDGLCLWNGTDGSLVWSRAVRSDSRNRTLHVEGLGIADLDGDGDLDIATGGYRQSTGDYAVVAFQASNGDPLWSFALADPVNCIEIGDIDGDGSPEVAAGDESNQVYCLNGEDGTEVFPAVTLPESNFAEDIELADFDGDGDLDIAAASYTFVTAYDESGVEMWRFDDFSADSMWWSDLDLADFNDDGVMDVAAVNHGGNGWALINGADGTAINSGGLFDVGTVAAAGDLDGNGTPEFVTGDFYNGVCPVDPETGNWLWLHDNANAFVYDLALADFNGDGSHAIVAVPGEDNFVYVLGGKSPYSYSAAGGVPVVFDWYDHTVEAYTEFSDVISFDADTDGDADLIAADSGLERIIAVDGEDGSMIWEYQCGYGYPGVLAPGDFDGDGDTEIWAFGGSSFYILDTDGTELYAASNSESPHHYLVADLDNDGSDDLVVGTQDGTVAALTYDQGSGFPAVAFETQYIGFSYHSDPSQTEAGLAYGDIDDDGEAELLALGYDSGTTYVYEIDLSESSGGSHSPVVSGTSWASIALAQLDDDVQKEILLGHALGMDAYDAVDGIPDWQAFTYDAGHGILAADLDGDGYDEAVAGGGDNLFGIDHDGPVLWAGDFSGTAANYYNDESIDLRDMELADLDADGDLDVAAVFHSGISLRMLDAATGDPLIEPIVLNSFAEGEIQLATGDFSSRAGTEVAVSSMFNTGVFGTVMTTSGTSTPGSSSSSSGCFISAIR